VITLYSYPELSGVADNNGYGLKVFAFLRLAGVDFTHEHVFDASAAPRGQLPYIVDDAEEIGDSDTIIAHIIAKYRLGIDDGLTPRQRDTNHLILRMLDDLLLGDVLLALEGRAVLAALSWDAGEHPGLAEAGLRKAQEFNSQRYYYQGIGRYSPTAAYARGLADLQVLANLMSASEYVHGPSLRASTQRSMGSSPISTFSRSIHLSRSSLWPRPVLSGIARPSMPQSVELH
jgi:glutathione S-transferase